MEALTHTLPDLKRFRSYVAGVLVVYLLVALLGLTTSHTSIVFGSEDEKASIVLGEPRSQRSDEFLRGSPRVIASLQEIPLQNYTPLDYTGSSKFRDTQAGIIGKVVRWSAPIHEIVIGEVGRRLPLAMGFSLQWWSSHVLLLIACPLWFVLLGRSGRAGGYCALAILFAPPNAWFSNLAAFLLANAIAAMSVFLLLGQIVERLKRRRFVLPVVGLLGIYAGRMAFTTAQYPPFGFPILGLVALVSLGALWRNVKHRRHHWPYIVFATAAIFGVILVWLHNRMLYSIALDTVYPGKRRDGGGESSEMFSWSGALSWFLQSSFVRARGGGNPEYALGPTFLLIPVLIIMIRQRARNMIDDQIMRTPLLLGLMWLLIIAAWAQYRWPSILVNGLNPLTWVPGNRAWQILGVIVIPVLFLVLGRRSGHTEHFSIGEALVCSLAVAAFTAGGLNALKAAVLPEANNSVIVLSVFFSVAVTFTVLAIRQFDLRVMGLVAFLIFSSILVNPLTRGLGAYQDSRAKSTILRLAAERPRDRWATTGFFEDALMISTGVAQLSGQQPLGPNKGAWRLIDPKEQFVDSWNRGQSYINFAWDGRPDWTIWNPSGDVIQVVISPCSKKLSRLRLGWVMSIQPISFPCLTKRAIVSWMGNDLFIYERKSLP
jgi:hypothetical protein